MLRERGKRVADFLNEAGGGAEISGEFKVPGKQASLLSVSLFLPQTGKPSPSWLFHGISVWSWPHSINLSSSAFHHGCMGIRSTSKRSGA